jgi:hypothetical protein
MLFFILLIVSGSRDLSGAIGHIQWSASVGTYNELFDRDAIPGRKLTIT